MLLGQGLAETQLGGRQWLFLHWNVGLKAISVPVGDFWRAKFICWWH